MFTSKLIEELDESQDVLQTKTAAVSLELFTEALIILGPEK